MKTIGDMLQRIDALRVTKDVTQWEDDFIGSCLETSRNGSLTAHLSGKQVEIIERIFNKHFAA